MIPWKELPMVKLKEAIEQEEWYKLSNGTMNVSTTESQYSQDNIPLVHITIFLTYEEGCTFSVRITFAQEYYICVPIKRIGGRSMRRRKSKTIHKTIKNILDFYERAIVYFDDCIETKKAQDKRTKDIENWRNDLAEKMDIGEVVGAHSTFTLNLSKHYRLIITTQRVQSDKIAQIVVSGIDLNHDTIRRIKDVILEDTGIMSDRLLNGK